MSSTPSFYVNRMRRQSPTIGSTNSSSSSAKQSNPGPGLGLVGRVRTGANLPSSSSSSTAPMLSATLPANGPLSLPSPTASDLRPSTAPELIYNKRYTNNNNNNKYSDGVDGNGTLAGAGKGSTSSSASPSPVFFPSPSATSPPSLPRPMKANADTSTFALFPATTRSSSTQKLRSVWGDNDDSSAAPSSDTLTSSSGAAAVLPAASDDAEAFVGMRRPSMHNPISRPQSALPSQQREAMQRIHSSEDVLPALSPRSAHNNAKIMRTNSNNKTNNNNNAHFTSVDLRADDPTGRQSVTPSPSSLSGSSQSSSPPSLSPRSLPSMTMASEEKDEVPKEQDKEGFFSLFQRKRAQMREEKPRSPTPMAVSSMFPSPSPGADIDTHTGNTVAQTTTPAAQSLPKGGAPLLCPVPVSASRVSSLPRKIVDQEKEGGSETDESCSDESTGVFHKPSLAEDSPEDAHKLSTKRVLSSPSLAVRTPSSSSASPVKMQQTTEASSTKSFLNGKESQKSRQTERNLSQSEKTANRRVRFGEPTIHAFMVHSLSNSALFDGQDSSWNQEFLESEMDSVRSILKVKVSSQYAALMHSHTRQLISQKQTITPPPENLFSTASPISSTVNTINTLNNTLFNKRCTSSMPSAPSLIEHQQALAQTYVSQQQRPRDSMAVSSQRQSALPSLSASTSPQPLNITPQRSRPVTPNSQQSLTSTPIAQRPRSAEPSLAHAQMNFQADQSVVCALSVKALSIASTVNTASLSARLFPSACAVFYRTNCVLPFSFSANNTDRGLSIQYQDVLTITLSGTKLKMKVRALSTLSPYNVSLQSLIAEGYVSLVVDLAPAVNTQAVRERLLPLVLSRSLSK